MDDVYRFRKNCYNLSQDTTVTNWISNETTDQVIKIGPFSFVPNLIYTEYNDGVYELCGPLLLVAEYFAKFSKMRIIIEPRGTIKQIFDNFAADTYNGVPHIGLISMYAPQFYEYVMVEGYTAIIRATKPIRFTQEDPILAKTKIDEDPLFKHFCVFEPEVYYGIVVSIVVISLITSLYRKSLKTFFTTFWSYISVILSDYYSFKLSTGYERNLCGPWLITCTVLLAAFSGQLRELVIKLKPIHWIDSWQDLYEWKHLAIQASSSSELYAFIHNFENHSWSIDFSRRLVNFTANGSEANDQDSLYGIDIDGVMAGRVASIKPYDILQISKKKFQTRDFKEDIHFHISTSGGWQPYFSLINRVNETLGDILDKGIVILRESGIFDNAIKIALNPRRIGADIGDKIELITNDVDEISIFQLRGIFILYILFLVKTFAILIMELFCFRLVTNK